MTNTPFRICILGAGSIGCYLGGQLAHGGAQVTFVGRERFQSALVGNGLTLTHYERGDIHIPASGFEFVLSPDGAANADIVLVCVKSQDSYAAGLSLAPVIKDDAIIISFQNGISNPDALAKALPEHTILGGVVPFNVTGTGPGHFHSGTEGDLIVQDCDDARLTALIAAFSGSGQLLTPVPDIKALQWGKLLVNLNNGLNALTGGTLHQGLSQRPYRKTLAAMIDEGLRVVKGAGITPMQFGKTSTEKTVKTLRLPNFLFKIIMSTILKIDKTARSSMLDDLEMGRGTEIDYLQGEIVALAKATGQTAPINQAVMDAVKLAFKNGESPKLSGVELWKLCQ